MSRISEMKTRVLVTRAEGVLVAAQLLLERGDALTALDLCSKQARDLSQRGVAPEVALKAWFAALSSFAALVEEGGALPQVLAEVMGALAAWSAESLPSGWDRYEDYRRICGSLLSAGETQTHWLTQRLCGWFSDDPRPHYAHGRALELRLVSLGEGAARAQTLQEAMSQYHCARGAAVRFRADARWGPLLTARMVRLLLAYPDDFLDSAARALRLAETLDRRALKALAPEYRFVVAAAQLRSARSMVRLRSLDALEALMAQERFRPLGRAAVEGYLESLGWGFYPTEQDRVRSIVEALGGGSARRVVAYLDLLQALHAKLGRHSLPGLAHLEELRAATLCAETQSVAATFYAVAIDLAKASPEGGVSALAALLEAHGVGEKAPIMALDEPLGLALECLRQRARPDRSVVSELLRAFSTPEHGLPQVQAALALLVPTILSRWSDWVELQPEARAALQVYLKRAPEPSFGFVALGGALVSLGEMGLARQAAQRALGSPEPLEKGAALEALLMALARHELEEGRPVEAVRWLVGVW